MLPAELSAAYLHKATAAPLGQMVLWVNRMAAGDDLAQNITVSRTHTAGDLQKSLAQLNVNLLSIVRDARQEAERMQVFPQEIAQFFRIDAGTDAHSVDAVALRKSMKLASGSNGALAAA